MKNRVMSRFAAGAALALVAAAGQAQDFYSVLFLSEFLLTLIPAILLLAPEARKDPRTLFNLSLLIAISGMAYRFIPTTIAYRLHASTLYFPTVAELTVAVGLIAIAIIGYLIAVKRFGVLPAPLTEWYGLMRFTREQQASDGAQPNDHKDHH